MGVKCSGIEKVAKQDFIGMICGATKEGRDICKRLPVPN